MPKLYYYTHTHWDREWYLPFESFRAQLVGVVRETLEQLEKGELSKFYLDGQAVVFDDLMEIDPSLKPRLQKFMESGQLAAGPWYVLADQILVGGESLVRNLKLGLQRTREIGPVSMVGYCPDTFGHSQDLPRILKGFGIDSAFVWRGVPLLETVPAFWWQSPDGSKVIAYHITNGYYQTSLHEHGYATKNGANGADLQKLANSFLPWVGLEKPTFAKSFNQLIDGALLPVGGDHFGPPHALGATVKQLNDHFKNSNQALELTPVNLGDFMDLFAKAVKAESKTLPVITGELRDNTAALQYARGYLLDGVLSTRLYLKRANRFSEFRMVRVCEPLFSVLNAFGLMKYPAAELNYGWTLLLKNHPHDSICGCSVDEVHREMMVRTAKIKDVLSALQKKADDIVSGATALPGKSSQDPTLNPDRAVVVNLSHSGVAPVPVEWTMPAGEKFPDFSNLVQVESKTRVEKLFAGWGILPYYQNVDVYKGWIWAPNVPAFGSKTIEWPPQTVETAAPVVQARANRLLNGMLEVKVEADGSLAVKAKVKDQIVTYKLGHRIVDTGDGGDSYNYDPLPNDKPISAKFVSAQVGRSGPLVGSLILKYEISIPETVVDAGSYSKDAKNELSKLKLLKRSPNKIKHEVFTEITLKRGVPILFFETAWENKAADHRMEVLFETGNTVFSTFAENHFSLVQRQHNRKAEKSALPVQAGCESRPERFPCQRFFVANGQAFFNMGLPEYGAQESRVSVTILRAISWLSKPRLWTRGGGAGPNVPVPEANCFGINKVSYGWAPLLVAQNKSDYGVLSDELSSNAYKLADQYEGASWAAFHKGASSLPEGEWLISDNEAIRPVSIYTSDDGKKLVVRLLNVTMSSQKTKLKTRFKIGSASLCRMDEQELAKVKFTSKGGLATAEEILFSTNESKTLVISLK